MSADYPDLPYVHARGDGGPRPRTQVIIIHATDNTAPASGEASYATRREDGTSAHYYVDDGQVIQALPIANIAYGALWHGNQVGVQYELCGRSNQLTDATIRRAAGQVARDCARYGIPVRKLTAAQVRAGERGICGHADVTAAWPEDGGDHTDPGSSFPWSTFIGYVAGPTLEDDMPLDPTELSMLDRVMRGVGIAINGAPSVDAGAWAGTPNVLHQKLDRLLASDAAEATAVAGLRAALDALAAAIRAGGGSVDMAAISALITTATSEVKALVEHEHAAEIAGLRAQLDALAE